jgi:hypothetical protein
MSDRTVCELCGRAMPVHASYVVRIDVFADPSMPQVTGEELAEMDFDAAFAQLVEQMKTMSAEDLQDQVHRRFEYRLCPACQRAFLANPLGLPRRAREGTN